MRTRSRTSSRAGPSTDANRPISQRSRLEDQVSSAIECWPTRSSHTLCQIPLVRGYQIECGSRSQSCLPRGFARSWGRPRHAR